MIKFLGLPDVYKRQLSYSLRLPVGGSVSVMRTTAVRDRERAMLWSKAVSYTHLDVYKRQVVVQLTCNEQVVGPNPT